MANVGISENEFESKALSLFQYQYKHVAVYKEFVERLNINPVEVDSLLKIPFLPIRFFKSHQVFTDEKEPSNWFESSGTTTSKNSKHFYTNTEAYFQNSVLSFEEQFGSLDVINILALLPSYLERNNSSLVAMVDYFMKNSPESKHGFYLNNFIELQHDLLQLISQNKKILLIGVSFALLDFAEQFSMPLTNCIVMETGGMKGRRIELTREQLHFELMNAFKIDSIASEYGMTELFSQGWSKSKGVFNPSSYMKVFCRDVNDPLKILDAGESGALNVIDLLNEDSCAFIATDDLGLVQSNGSFEVRGRLDNSDVRGCNLMF